MGLITLTMSALLSFGKVGSSSDDGSDAVKTVTEIVNAGKEVLKLDVNIYTRQLTNNVRKQLGLPYSMYAFVSGKNGNYIMYVSPTLKGNRLIEIIAHELIHVQQFESGRLDVGKGYVLYNDRKYKKPKNIPYLDRAWEAEAFRKQYRVRKLIIAFLNGKITSK